MAVQKADYNTQLTLRVALVFLWPSFGLLSKRGT